MSKITGIQWPYIGDIEISVVANKERWNLYGSIAVSNSDSRGYIRTIYCSYSHHG